MKSPQRVLSERIEAAVRQVAPDAALPPGPLAVPSQDERFGDYQCNLAMGLAKAMKSNPRALATQLIEKLDVHDVCEPPEIAGPGFINLKLQRGWMSQQLTDLAQATDGRLGVDPVDKPETIIVDYSSPNVAKSMHIGHIRSTVLGAAIANLLRFAGHKVVTDNHLGDWGTQFGTLIVGYREMLDPAAFKDNPIAELERIYKTASERAKTDTELEARIRHELARLQAGDDDNLALWRMFMEVSRQQFEKIYDRLGAKFDLWHGESFYNPMLAETIKSLMDAGLAREDQGAVVIFFPDDPELGDKPLIIRKRDGAALYSTTDLAGVRYRVDTYHPSRILILTDGRQQLHFKQIFTTARKWGYQDVELSHVWFGSILGADGSPLKTREGDPVKLADVLDEAEQRALDVARKGDVPEDKLAEVARAVGIGAVKYADLSQNRTSDYVFSWDKLLAMQGNTGPYPQYAHTRPQSIFRKAGLDPATLRGPVLIEADAEKALGKRLLRFGDAIFEALDGYRPNVLTSYLYDLAVAFSGFYEKCPVLTADEPQRTSRLTLCRLTGDALKLGVGLLGIETPSQM